MHSLGQYKHIWRGYPILKVKVKVRSRSKVKPPYLRSAAISAFILAQKTRDIIAYITVDGFRAVYLSDLYNKTSSAATESYL